MEYLTSSEKNVLEYFWNSHINKKRRFISKTIITYLDNEKYESEIAQLKNSTDISRYLLNLESKNYIKVYKKIENDTIYELQEDGILYFYYKYSKLKLRLQSLIQSTPILLTITVAILGLISSIFGIIQFIDWMTKK